MANPFAITAATNTLTLDSKRQGEVSFTVTNVANRPLRGRASVVPQPEALPNWFTIVGEAERDFALNATQQYTVRVAVPSDVAAGRYLFRLDAVDVELPEERLTEGPSVTFEVPPPPPPKPFPWWIIAVVAGVIIVLGVILAIVLGGNAELAVAVSDSPDPVTAGEELVYTVALANEGSAEAAGVVVVITLPPGVALGAAEGAICEAEQASPILTCALDEPMAEDAEATLVISGTVAADAAGILTIQVAARDEETDPEDALTVEVETTVQAAPPPTPTPTPEPTPTAVPGAWSGAWLIQCDLLPCDELAFTQTGDSVTGTFAGGDGRLNGTVDGNRLSGSLELLGATSTFDFWLDDTGQFWQGNWNRLLAWCGYRAGGAPPAPCGIASWAGNWTTDCGPGGSCGSILLFQDGTRVFGNYAGGGGLVEAVANGVTLSGTWTRSGTSGSLEYFMIAEGEGRQFNGNWNNSVQWCGARDGAALPGTCAAGLGGRFDPFEPFLPGEFELNPDIFRLLPTPAP